MSFVGKMTEGPTKTAAEKAFMKQKQVLASRSDAVGDWTQMFQVQSVSRVDCSTLDPDHDGSGLVSKGSYTDPSEDAFHFKELTSYRTFADKFHAMEMKFADETRKFAGKEKKLVPAFSLLKYVRIEFLVAAAVAVAGGLSMLKVEQILGVAVAAAAVATVVSFELVGELCQSSEDLKWKMDEVQVLLMQIKREVGKLEMEMGWMYSSVKKIEFTTNAKEGNMVKLNLQVFDKLGYIEQRLMWLVSGSQDTVRQIAQDFHLHSEMPKLKRSLQHHWKLWSATRLRFRDLKQEELAAAFQKLMSSACEAELEKLASWKQRIKDQQWTATAEELLELDNTSKLMKEAMAIDWMREEMDL